MTKSKQLHDIVTSNRKFAFTLVELIVVVTIVAILGTIVFLSFVGYNRNTRDSRRVADIYNIRKSLDLFFLQTGKYPLPDNSNAVMYSGDVLWYQGVIGDGVVTQLSRVLGKKPTDPLSHTEYIYSTTFSQRQYELMMVYEEGIGYSFFPQNDPITSGIVRVDGNYNQLFIETPNYIVPTPSIITSELFSSGTGMILDNENIKSQVVSGGRNSLAIGPAIAYTGGLDISLSVYTGSITKNSSEQDKIDVIHAIQLAYSGTLLGDNGIYNDTLSQEQDVQMAYFADIIFDIENSSAPPVVASLEGWRSLDPNCDIDDIVIGSQVWAGCNSTLGTGMEYGELAANSCFDYQGSNSATGCDQLSNQKESSWNATYGIDNIWGKLYTWPNANNTACPSPYHLPSDAEWQTLETTLNGGINCRTVDTGDDFWGECDGLGWAGHTSKNASNNIVQALKLPLAGVANYDPGYWRGSSAILRTSTFSAGYYYRSFEYNQSAVNRGSSGQSYGNSVRCIRD